MGWLCLRDMSENEKYEGVWDHIALLLGYLRWGNETANQCKNKKKLRSPPSWGIPVMSPIPSSFIFLTSLSFKQVLSLLKSRYSGCIEWLATVVGDWGSWTCKSAGLGLPAHGWAKTAWKERGRGEGTWRRKLASGLSREDGLAEGLRGLLGVEGLVGQVWAIGPWD